MLTLNSLFETFTLISHKFRKRSPCHNTNKVSLFPPTLSIPPSLATWHDCSWLRNTYISAHSHTVAAAAALAVVAGTIWIPKEFLPRWAFRYIKTFLLTAVENRTKQKKTAKKNGRETKQKNRAQKLLWRMNKRRGTAMYSIQQIMCTTHKCANSEQYSFRWIKVEFARVHTHTRTHTRHTERGENNGK